MKTINIYFISYHYESKRPRSTGFSNVEYSTSFEITNYNHIKLVESDIARERGHATVAIASFQLMRRSHAEDTGPLLNRISQLEKPPGK